MKKNKTYQFFGLATLVLMLTAFVQKQDTTTVINLEEYDKIIAKAESFFKAGNCRIDYQMASYKNHDSKVPHDIQKGYTILKGQQYYSVFLGITTVQTKKYRITIDTVDQTLSIANPIESETYKPLLENYKLFKQYFKTIKKDKTKDGFKLEIQFKERLKVQKIEIDFGADGFMKKSVSYLNAAIQENNTDKNSPRSKPKIETYYTGYKKINEKEYIKLFDDKNYLITTNNKLTGVTKYKHYKISDTRVKK